MWPYNQSLSYENTFSVITHGPISQQLGSCLENTILANYAIMIHSWFHRIIIFQAKANSFLHFYRELIWWAIFRWQRLTSTGTWISNHVSGGIWDVITHACPIFNSGLTHLPLDDMAAISQMVFSNAFSWMQDLCLIKIWFIMVQLIIFQHCFR